MCYINKLDLPCHMPGIYIHFMYLLVVFLFIQTCMFSSLSILHIVLRWKMLGDLFFFITQVLRDHWFLQLPQFNQLRQRSYTAYGWKAHQNGRASGYIIYALYEKKHSAGRYVTTAVIWVSPLYACGSLSFQRPTLPLALSHFFPPRDLRGKGSRAEDFSARRWVSFRQL